MSVAAHFHSRRLQRALFAAAVLVGSFATAHGQPAAGTGTEGLDIVTGTGRHHLDVEVMRTPAELERGLMFRRFMPEDRGMLFDFGVEEPVSFWMKNTYLPLDMIFIARNGRVVGIKANAEPMSERVIPSGAPTYGVLEVNAGTAARLGVKTGDNVSASIFKK